MSVTNKAVPTLFDLGAEDLPALLALTAQVGWPHTAADWTDYLDMGAVFGIRDADGGLAACTALFRYGPQLASVGLVIVDERHRGEGLGRVMMQRCLDTAAADVLALIATPLGRPMYERLGFQTIDHVAKHIGDPDRSSLRAGASSVPVHPVAMLTPEILQQILDLDRQSQGAPRDAVLRRLAARSVCTVVARDSFGSLTGFALLLQKQGFAQLAPVVAADDDVALALIAEAAAKAGGALRIDVPVGRVRLLTALRAAGWTHTSDDPLMTLHGTALPGRRGAIAAIAFQALG